MGNELNCLSFSFKNMNMGVGGQHVESNEVRNISNQSTSAVVAAEITPVGP